MKAIKDRFWGNKEKEEVKNSASNPYLNARRAWNTHTAGLMKSLHLWQFVGGLSLLLSLSAVGGLIFIGSQSKFIPLVFQQDANGNTLSVTRADKVSQANIDDYRTAAAHFIENLRMVSRDVELQKKAVFQVYSFLNGSDAALSKVYSIYKGEAHLNPFERAAKEVVSISISSVLQASESSWQVDWIETTRNLDGSLKENSKSFKALLTMYQNTEISDVGNDAILKNPHLIYVRDFNITAELNRGTRS